MNLLKHADTALHQAKASGRDAQRRYTHASVDALEQLAMAGRLRRAIDEENLRLHYQPLVDLKTGAIVGVEALVRWQDGNAPGHAGRLHPAGRAHRPDRRHLGVGDLRGLRQGCAWRDAGLDLYVSVNLPPAYWEPTAMRGVLRTIESFGLSPDRMMIEITESAFMNALHRNEPCWPSCTTAACTSRSTTSAPATRRSARLHQMAVRRSRSTARSSPTCRMTAAPRCSSRRSSRWPRPRPAAARRGHRDRGAARVPDRARLPAGPGLPVQQAGAGGADRAARAGLADAA